MPAIPPPDDVGNTTGTALPVSTDVAQFYHLETSGDNDVFSFTLTAGKEYLFNMRGLDTGHGDVADPKLQLWDASGTLISLNADQYKDDLTGSTNHDAQIIYVAPSNGIYYLNAFGAAGNTGTYTLGIGEKTELPGTTSDPNVQTLGMFDAQVSILGTPTDVDVYKVHLQAGLTYALDMLGAGDRGSLPDGYLSLYDPNGVFITADNDSGTDKDARIIYTPSVDGDYFLKAEAADKTAGHGDTGFYWMYTAQLTGQNYMDSLLAQWNESWQPDNPGDPIQNWHWTLTYSFMASAPTYANAADKVGFQVLDSAHQDAIRAALTAWGNLTNITFVESVDSPDIKLRFGANSGGVHGNAVAAYAYYPSPAVGDLIGGDVYLNANDSLDFNNFAPGEYGYSVLLHEIGHALGLKHPGDYNAGDDGGSPGLAPFLPADQDSRMNTVMSYNADSLSGGVEPMTPMLFDIDAIQWLYGANMTLHGGNDTYAFNQGDHPLEAIWDPAGKDTFDASTMTSAVTIDLTEFHMSSIGGTQNVGIANGSVIENAKGGAGNDQLIGNAVKNVLTGNGGNDTLTGGAGADSLVGGAGNDSMSGGTGADTMNGGGGNDIYVVDNANDSITDSAGIDGVQSSISWTLGTGLENLVLTGNASINGTGNELGNAITGNGNKNVLTGGIGNDTLDGGAGIDTLDGGADNDLFVVTAGDVIIDSGGNDTVSSAGTWSLAGNPDIENLTLTGSANVNATGNDLANTITGNAGSNLLTGGLGADLLRGGAGDDIFVWDPADVVVTGAIQGGTGNDTLRVTGTKTVNLGTLNGMITSVENVDLSGTGDTLKMTYGNVHAMSGGTQLTVSGGADDHLYLGGTGWSHTVAGDTMIGGTLYYEWTNTAGANFVLATATIDVHFTT